MNRFNWEACLEIRITEDQQRFTPSVLYSLAQAKFEAMYPYGVTYKEKMVGFLMYANFSGVYWINRVLIDVEYQRKGIARQAVSELIRLIQRKRDCKEVRTSYASDNIAAKSLFTTLGFKPINEAMSEEVVATFAP